jgi:hypothetical protein
MDLVSESSYSMLDDDESDFGTSYSEFPEVIDNSDDQDSGEILHNMLPFFKGKVPPGQKINLEKLSKITEEVRVPAKIPTVIKRATDSSWEMNSRKQESVKKRAPFEMKIMNVDDHSKIVLDYGYSNMDSNINRPLIDRIDHNMFVGKGTTNEETFISDFFKELYEKASFDVYFDNLDIYIEQDQKNKILPIFSSIDLKERDNLGVQLPLNFLEHSLKVPDGTGRSSNIFDALCGQSFSEPDDLRTVDSVKTYMDECEEFTQLPSVGYTVDPKSNLQTERLYINQRNDQENRYIQSKHDIRIKSLKNDINMVLDSLIINDSVNKIKSKYNYVGTRDFEGGMFKMSYMEEPKSISSRNTSSELSSRASRTIGPDIRGDPRNPGAKFNISSYHTSNPVVRPPEDEEPSFTSSHSHSHADLLYAESSKPYIEDSVGVEGLGFGLGFAPVAKQTVYDELHILWNKTFEFVSVVEGSLGIVNDNPEYGFTHYKTISVPNISPQIRDLVMELDSEEITIEILDAKLEIISKTMSIDNLDSVKTQIFDYIRHNYTISDDPSKKLKASVLLKAVNGVMDNKKTSHNKLSTYLKELGLQRKRLSDGMYYYGLDNKWKSDSKNLLADLVSERKKYILG